MSQEERRSQFFLFASPDRCKSFTRDATYSSQLHFIRQSDVAKLPSDLPTGICARTNKAKRYIDMIHKYADIIAKPPLNLRRAAVELNTWADGKDLGTELLDVSYCSLVPYAPVPRLQRQVVDVTAGGAVALEPTPGVVSIANAPKRAVAACSGVTDHSRCVYDMAASLVKHHNKTWAAAIRQAEALHAKSKVSGKKRKRKAVEFDLSDEEDDGTSAQLDIVPLR